MGISGEQRDRRLRQSRRVTLAERARVCITVRRERRRQRISRQVVIDDVSQTPSRLLNRMGEVFDISIPCVDHESRIDFA